MFSLLLFSTSSSSTTVLNPISTLKRRTRRKEVLGNTEGSKKEEYSILAYTLCPCCLSFAP